MKTLRRWTSSLAFQSIAPTLALLLTFTAVAAGLTYKLLAKFTELQYQVNTSSEASEALLSLEQNRSRIRESMLMLQAKGQKAKNDTSQLDALEIASANERIQLKELIGHIESRPMQLESFFAGSRETRALRNRARAALLTGDRKRAPILMDSYLVLYRVNTARLEDLQQFLSLHIRTKQTELAELLRLLPIYLFALFLMQLVLTAGFVIFHRKTVLLPLQGILRGMGQVAKGHLDEKIEQDKGPSEIREMTLNFNLMTSMLNKTNQDLEQARAKAELSAKAKSEFLSNMSHEIRTPLNVIVGLADILYERERAKPAAERVRNKESDKENGNESGKEISVLFKSTRILMTLINDILDYSRFEAGHVTLTAAPFDLKETIDEITMVLSSVAQNKGLQFRVDQDPKVPAYVVADEFRLKQVLLNLISNAVKFTEAGHILLKVSWEPDGKRLIFTIGDTGIGMSAEQLSRIFNRFEQAESGTNRKFGGTGLGLAIVRETLKLFGGEVKVESAVGKGTSFTVTVPVEVARDFGAPAAVMAQQSGQNPVAWAAGHQQALKVLLVDDSDDNRMLVKTYLRDQSQIWEATNGQQALTLFKTAAFDLVLMDIQMPVMDGLEATRLIREFENAQGRKPIPVIALTAFSLPEEIGRTQAAGCTMHVTKPVRKHDLISKIYDLTAGNARTYSL
jgi:signal transduction histidine kinase